MKTAKKSLFAALLLLLLCVPLFTGASVSASAEIFSGYDADDLADRFATISGADFGIRSYGIEMDLSAGRTIAVKETITAEFYGPGRHGMIRDFPLGEGVRYEDFDVSCDSEDFAPYFSIDDSDFLSLYLRGSGVVTGQTRTYTLTYRMIAPKFSEDGYLPIDVIGYGWSAPIRNVSAQIAIPGGLREYRIYSGVDHPKTNSLQVEDRREGNVIYLTAADLSAGAGCGGITLDLLFEEGALTGAADYGLWIAFGCGVGALAVAAILFFLFCRQPTITPTVNFTAPEEIDPLLMGKLIDGTVDNEDLGALVFYLADKGYLTIDMNGGDPILTKTDRPLPRQIPAHIRLYMEGLFNNRGTVRASELSENFYRTANTVKGSVGDSAGKLYPARNYVVFAAIALLSVILLGGFSILYPYLTVSSRAGLSYFYWAGVFAVAVSFALAAIIVRTVSLHRFKWNKAKYVLGMCSAVLSLLPAPIILLFPCAAYGIWCLFVLTLFAALAGCVGGICLTARTKEYAARLGQILGFRQFILFTEKDKIEFMLKENPELYYHILPYAQVLGITDAWTDKFKGLDLNRPAYLYGGSFDLFDLILFNNLFRNVSMTFARSMVSRPSSSGRGINHGGFGGGFGGGGIGGGGGRSC